MENFISDRELSDPNHKETWKPLFRQVLITSGSCTIFFSMGMMLGTPTVAIPQLRRANITVSDNMASWLSSTFSYAGIPWMVILAMMARIYGRKKTTIFISLATIISFIVLYFSTTTTHLLITEITFGVTQAAVVSISIVIISEYTSAKYRGGFLCFKSASFMWGVWIANAIGIFFFWGYIAVAGIVVSSWSLTIFFWPESPLWLASKNKFDECRKAHRWLKGRSEDAEMELENLIQAQIEPDLVDLSIKNIRFVSRREFYMPLLISMVAVLQYHWSGKYVIAIYAIDILKNILKTDSTVYSGMLILDGVSVFSAYIGCFLAKLFNRRTIWIFNSIAAILFLLTLALYIYLVKISILSENVYISIFLLSGFSMFISSGPMILATSLFGELIPHKYKTVSIVIIGLEFAFLQGTFMKLSPMVFKALGLSGTFLFYVLGVSFCTLFIYLYLPETKDKTLLEIEKYFRDKRGVEARNLVA